MKKYYLIIIATLLGNAQLRAQQKDSKPPINNGTYKTWTTLQNCNISNNGRYVWYEYSTRSAPGSLTVCTTDGKYKREFRGARNAHFTADSKRLVFDGPEGFGILELGRDSVQYPGHGGDFFLPKDGGGRWLAYHTDSAIVLKDMITGKENSYPKASVAWFNDQGTALLVQTPASLSWVSLADGKEKTIMHGSQTSQVSFDATGTRVAFITLGTQGKVLRYYRPGADTAAIHVTDNSPGINTGFVIADDAPWFSADGRHIFFKLAINKAASVVTKDSTVITGKVDIWHYKDRFLQSRQMETLPELNYRTYMAAAPVDADKVVQLESFDTKIVGLPGSKYALVSNIVNDLEAYWNKDEIAGYQLVTLADGSRKDILPERHNVYFCQLSPGEQFVTWWDPKSKNHFCYEVATGITRNITQAIGVPVYNDDQRLVTQNTSFQIAGWVKGDGALLVNDRYDIWQVDPLGKKHPVNITGGYGRSHRITFRAIVDNSRLITSDPLLLLTALNNDNKYNGFWKKTLGTSGAPIPCADMAPCLYYFPGADLFGHPPVKAKNAGVYLVQRASAAEAPNLFAMTGFNSFIPLSDIQPQKAYNWMTSELLHWKMPDGQAGEGVLYKPENFDPKKKYPVIFYYYERKSNELYVFRKPDLSNGTLNIPWFVSNGYLVCLTDIYYTIGHTGQSVVTSVETAAKYLSAFPWVDASKMGLEGHSFGGYETNYLVTHSTLFAAAQESAGMSDMTSWYGGIAFGGISTAEQCEEGHSNIHTTPWQRPDIYLENSPVYSLDKVITPLLILHNKGDGAVPFSHAVAMFTGLRRLQKPAWLLQYDGEDHTLTDKACRLDFSIRQEQFFDHYLKGALMPVWMAEGISAKDKGIQSGLLLEKP